jgi:hypothetical protein
LDKDMNGKLDTTELRLPGPGRGGPFVPPEDQGRGRRR